MHFNVILLAILIFHFNLFPLKISFLSQYTIASDIKLFQNVEIFLKI